MRFSFALISIYSGREVCVKSKYERTPKEPENALVSYIAARNAGADDEKLTKHRHEAMRYIAMSGTIVTIYSAKPDRTPP